MVTNTPSLETECIYEIDADDRIVFCNEVWDRFAEENSGDNVLSHQVKERNLWDFIGDSSTIYIYRRLISHVRGGNSVRFNFRCDSPSLYRLLEMKIDLTPEKRIRFSTLTVQTKHAGPATPNEEVNEVPMIACSWCGRVKTQQQSWEQLEMVVSTDHIFEKPESPISHGICESCFAEVNTLIPRSE